MPRTWRLATGLASAAATLMLLAGCAVIVSPLGGNGAASNGSDTASSSSDSNSSRPPATDAGSTPPPLLPDAGDPIPPPADDLPTINEARLAELRRIAPFTRPESGDGRDPSHNARQLLLALADESADRLQAALHPDSPIRIDASDPGAWSLWRALLGRHNGLLGWGLPDATRHEVVCLLASPPDRAETTWLRMVPWQPPPAAGAPGAAPSGETAAPATATARAEWRVMDAGVTLEPTTVCAPDCVIYARLDRTVAQPAFTGPEKVLRVPLGPDLPVVVRELVENVRASRDVAPRVITAQEWRDTSPPALLADRPVPDDLAAILRRRLQRVTASGLDLAACVVLTRHQLAGSPTVFARCLLVFGRPDQVRRACITRWRSVKGIYKLSELTFIPLPANVDELLARAVPGPSGPGGPGG